MRKLLRANFSRLWQNRTFWLLSVLMVLFSIFIAVDNIINMHREGSAWEMDFSLFIYVVIAPILTSVFVALFVGSDYSGGTLRNKLIAGHRRGNIYLANLITCYCAGLFLCAAFVIPQGALGLLLGGQTQSTPAKFLVYGALSLALMGAYTALFTLIAMLCQNRSYTVAGCILLTFVLIFFGVYIASALDEPEYLAGYSYTENGVTVEEPETKNPNYISGTKRKVYEYMQDFTPGGQVLQISAMNAGKPVMLALYDGIILLTATGLGMVLFERKDLR